MTFLLPTFHDTSLRTYITQNLLSLKMNSNQAKNTLINIETRGEMRKRQNREHMAALRAEKLLTMECQGGDLNVPSHIWKMDKDFEESTEKYATWPQLIKKEVANRALAEFCDSITFDKLRESPCAV